MRGCRSPLPPLFMRFVIQAVTHAPQLRGFVCDTLAALVNKAVWANPQQWKGWIVCVTNLVPDSLPVLLQVMTPPQRGISAAIGRYCPEMQAPCPAPNLITWRHIDEKPTFAWMQDAM